MVNPEELRIGSLTTTPVDRIPFSSLLDMKSLNGGIREVHAVLDENNRTPQVLADITRRAFGVEIKSGQVQVSDYIPDRYDDIFAKEFGFRIIPVAYTALRSGEVEAWIGPTLIPEGHPLYHGTEKDNSINVVSEEVNGNNEAEKPDTKKGFSYYVRLRVEDKASVMSTVAEEFGNLDINIKGVFQHLAQDKSQDVDIAFLLSPCSERALQLALTMIKGLNTVVSVNAPLRAFNKGK